MDGKKRSKVDYEDAEAHERYKLHLNRTRGTRGIRNLSAETPLEKSPSGLAVGGGLLSGNVQDRREGEGGRGGEATKDRAITTFNPGKNERSFGTRARDADATRRDFIAEKDRRAVGRRRERDGTKRRVDTAIGWRAPPTGTPPPSNFVLRSPRTSEAFPYSFRADDDKVEM